MNTNITITLIILVLMIIGFLCGKFKLGLVGMTTATLLCLTKVLKFEDAYAYLANNNVVMIAAMFVLVGALGKTSLIYKIRQYLLKCSGKGYTILIAYFAACFILAQFMTPLAVISILLPFMSALDEKSNVQPSNLLLPGAVLSHTSQAALPIGMGITYFVMMNAFLQASGCKQTISMFSYSEVVFVPAMIALLYMIFFAWKKFPKQSIDTNQINKDKEFKPVLTPLQEKIVYASFIIVFVGITANKLLPFPMYILPIMADLILTYCNALNLNDVKNFINLDAIFMLAGVLPLGTALQKTGAGKLIAKLVVTSLGGKPSGIILLIAFYILSAVFTQFMSNTACQNTFTPLAIVTALAQGIDPRAFCVAIMAGTTAAMLTPASSPSVAIAFSAGKYKIKDELKAFLPLWIIYGIVVIFMANLVFPV